MLSVNSEQVCCQLKTHQIKSCVKMAHGKGTVKQAFGPQNGPRTSFIVDLPDVPTCGIIKRTRLELDSNHMSRLREPGSLCARQTM